MTIDSLFEQLKHPNPNLQERAMLELAEIKDEQTIPRLMSILAAEDVPYRRTAVKALGYIGLDAIPALVDGLVNNDDATIRTSCAKALAQVAVNHSDIVFPQEAIQGLAKGMQDANPVVNLSSVMSLGAIGVPAIEVLLEAIKTTDNPALGVAIVNALSSIDDPRCLETLTAVSNDDSADSYVRESAVSALSRLEMMMKYKWSR